MVRGFNIENCTESSGNGILVINPSSAAVLENICISNNMNRAIYVHSESVVTVKNSVFHNDGSSQLDGGVIHVVSRVSLNITNSSFSSKCASLRFFAFSGPYPRGTVKMRIPQGTRHSLLESCTLKTTVQLP